MCNMIFSLKGYTREYMMLQMDGIGVDYTGFNIQIKIKASSNFFRKKRTVGVRDTDVGLLPDQRDGCKRGRDQNCV